MLKGLIGNILSIFVYIIWQEKIKSGRICIDSKKTVLQRKCLSCWILIPLRAVAYAAVFLYICRLIV